MNEIAGSLNDGNYDAAWMDHSNNMIGLSIGQRARTYDDVLEMAREAIARGADHGGSGANGTAMWFPRERWGDPKERFSIPPSPDGLLTWQRDAPVNPDYMFSGKEHRFLDVLRPDGPSRREAEAARLNLLAQVPSETWTEEDVRAVIRSHPTRTAAILPAPNGMRG